MSAKLLPFRSAAALSCDRLKRAETQGDAMHTHAQVSGFWLDRLIATGDPEDTVSMLHRQQSWLAMMQDRLVGG